MTVRRTSAARAVRRHIRDQNPGQAQRLSAELDLPEAAARVLVARGINDVEEARRYLSPGPESLHDPFEMAGVREATERIAATARRGGRIVVFGDYDCDGVGALAILTAVLGKLGADVRPFIPHRLNDGYGLKRATLERALSEHEPEGVVTVDCGITAVDPVSVAVERGVYVVVTDHHLPPSELPAGAVLVDPKIPGCRYPFKDLCGAGIAWKLAEALLVADGERVGLGQAQRQLWMASLAKIAALATVADMVPLTGENRVLTAWGLTGLADPRSPGLSALLARSGVPAGRSPSSREVAFRIAPRLNAAGRIDHAYRSLALLTTADRAEAERLAEELEAANEERRELQERLVSLVMKRLEETFDPDGDAVVIESGSVADGWHRGVLGIAAARVASAVARPVLLMAQEGEWVGGSGRTYGRTPLHARLAPVARRYARDFGGHAAALGITVPVAAYEEFRREARQAFADGRDDGEWVEDLHVDAEVEPDELTVALAQALRAFEPHGAENPKPLLLVRNVAWDGRGQRVGERGIRFQMSVAGRRLDVLSWTLGETPQSERRGVFDLCANLVIDPYTGRPTLTAVNLARAPS